MQIRTRAYLSMQIRTRAYLSMQIRTRAYLSSVRICSDTGRQNRVVDKVVEQFLGDGRFETAGRSTRREHAFENRLRDWKDL